MQIEFNGQMYKRDTLASLVGFGHKEMIDTKELVVIKDSECESKQPIAYKHNGKTYVLAGTVDLSKDQVQIVVISKHILKKGLMSVQSQPIDNHVDFVPQSRYSQDRIQQKSEERFKNPVIDERAKAALRILSNANSSAPSLTPQRQTVNRSSEATKKALAVLERAMSRR
jgi:hypothetical protein